MKGQIYTLRTLEVGYCFDFLTYYYSVNISNRDYDKLGRGGGKNLPPSLACSVCILKVLKFYHVQLLHNISECLNQIGFLFHVGIKLKPFHFILHSTNSVKECEVAIPDMYDAKEHHMCSFL